MNNPLQTPPAANPRPPRLKIGRAKWIVIGVVIGVLLLGLLVIAAATLLGLLAADNPDGAFAIGLAGAVFLLGGVLLLTLLIVVIVLAAVRRKIRAAQDWPSTGGLVLVSEVRDEGGETGWRANVVYRYEVGGRVYQNSRIAVAVEYGVHSFQAQERLAARFPAGSQVTVYYDPQNPADAALVKGDPNSLTPSLF